MSWALVLLNATMVYRHSDGGAAPPAPDAATNRPATQSITIGTARRLRLASVTSAASMTAVAPVALRPQGLADRYRRRVQAPADRRIVNDWLTLLPDAPDNRGMIDSCRNYLSHWCG
ncbi:hypothetical protein RE9425_15030 [Prescottella equi]|nr:hypothetical protein RE9425_15030 [Prescottella equi]